MITKRLMSRTPPSALLPRVRAMVARWEISHDFETICLFVTFCLFFNIRSIIADVFLCFSILLNACQCFSMLR